VVCRAVPVPADFSESFPSLVYDVDLFNYTMASTLQLKIAESAITVSRVGGIRSEQ